MTGGEGADRGIPDGPWTSAAAWSRAGWRVHRAAGAASAGGGPAGDDEPGGRDWAGAATLPELAARSAQRVPHRVAVSVDGQPVTHGQLDAQARQAAGWLAGRLDRGERMLLAAGTSLGFLCWYLGALRAGVVVVLANPGYTAAELGHLVADSGARLAVADPVPAQRLAGLDLAGPGLAALQIVPVGPATGRPEGAPAVPPPALPDLEDTALLAYTSGTTGRPKGVPLTHGQLAASVRGAMAAWRWTAGDVLVHALPLFHQHGLGGVHATLIAGSTAHLRSRSDPAGLIAAARAGGGTVLFGVPATYQALLDSAVGTTAASAPRRARPVRLRPVRPRLGHRRPGPRSCPACASRSVAPLRSARPWPPGCRECSAGCR